MALSELFTQIIELPWKVEPVWWAVIIASFVACQLIYKLTDWYFSKNSKAYSSLPKVDKLEWQTRVVSTIHAVIVFPICLYFIVTDYEHAANAVHGNNFWTSFCMALGVGYFASDAVYITIHNIQPWTPIMLHHVFAGWGFLAGVSTIGKGQWFGMLLLLTEGSTPFNNMHWHYEKSNKSSILFTFFAYMYALTWLVFRIRIIPYLFSMLYTNLNVLLNETPIIVQTVIFVNTFFLVTLNVTWFIIGPFYGIVFGNDAKATSPSSTTTATTSNAPTRIKKSQ